jgi:hypothetical protein
VSETELRSTVPAADPVEARILQLQRWLEGYVDTEGRHRPGLIELVAKLYDELERRNERCEAIKRGVTLSVLGTLFAALIVWFKDHLK